MSSVQVGGVYVSPCPGMCNAQWRKAEAARVEGVAEHELIPRPGEPVWCEGCSLNIASALRHLPEDVARVFLEMQNGSPKGHERVSGSRSRPLHAKESLARFIEEIHGVLTGWEDDTRELRRYSPRQVRRQAVQIDYSARFLLGQLDWILGRHPYAEATKAFGWEITGLHRKALKVTQNDDPSGIPTRCPGVRCPRCTWKALVRELDSEKQPTAYVLCENCGRLLNEGEYRTAVTTSLRAVR